MINTKFFFSHIINNFEMTLVSRIYYVTKFVNFNIKY